MSGTIPGPGESSDSPEAVEPRVGHKIGPYRLVKLLGQGTSGRVFEVEHVKIGRRAAMKTLTGERANSPGALKRLFTEALAVNRINNPHIVEVTDIVEKGEHHLVQNGRESVSSLQVNALVMELLEGQSLQQAMIGEGPMSPERFLPILAQVAEALAAAHAAGFIHRDLKPDNIFLAERSGRADFVKLLDFGLTKVIGGGHPGLGPGVPPALAQGQATLDGTFVGTPAYISPEQASAKAVDHRTDIYSLGVILYELCCGRLPFEGESIGDYIIKHLTVPPPPLPEEIVATKLGRTLDGIIQRCLDKDPANRFPSAAQLAEIFAALARGEPVQFTAMETYQRRGGGGSDQRGLMIFRVALGLGAGLLVVTGVLLLTSGGARYATPALTPTPTPTATPAPPPAPMPTPRPTETAAAPPAAGEERTTAPPRRRPRPARTTEGPANAGTERDTERTINPFK